MPERRLAGGLEIRAWAQYALCARDCIMAKLKYTFKTDTLFKMLFVRHQDL